jgi:LAS superfamily LD-carboxypeptidase LdcB
LPSVRRSRAARRRLAFALVAAALLGPPAVAVGASPAQEAPGGSDDGTSQGVDDAGGRGGTLDIDTDPFRASGTVLDGTLDSLTENVGAQLAQLESARGALAEAEAAVAEAETAIEATEARIDELVVQSDAVVVDAFMNPPTEAGLDALAVDSLAEATVKQQILDTTADANADVLEELGTARDELEVLQAEQEEQQAAAEAAEAAAEAELADLEGAQSQQALFVVQVQDRLDRNLAEAANLEATDPELAAQIRGREGEIASKLQEIRDAEQMAEALAALQLAQEQAEAEARAEAERLAEQTQGTGDIGGASGSLVTVSCPAGGSITVDSAMGPGLTALLAAAAADGIEYCGGGYRDPSEQIALRRSNCGTSDYAIYEMPSSSCSPPTARPGSSNHEEGLAVDFTCNGGGTIQSQGSECFQWLDAHGADYGFYNLPSEPWHWSNDGT